VNAEIVSIGNELLRGEIVDTNASYLASQLSLLGIALRSITQVGDDKEELVEALKQAWERSQFVLTTGGLGPTQDDLTREAIAGMLGEELNVDPALEQELRAMFVRWGREMPPHNIKQATLIPSAQGIPNPRGTAPGWWIERGEKTMLVLPGPPSEMERMWKKEILPRLLQQNKGQAVASRTVKTFGVAEAEVSELASPLFASAGLELGIYAKPDGIHLRLIARASEQEEAEKRVWSGEAKLKEIFAGHIWGSDDDTLEGAIGAFLIDKGLTLATMESCTGGLLAATINDAEESHACYRGGLVISSAHMEQTSGIDVRLVAQYGIASEEVAGAMSAAARRLFGADIGIGVTGLIGASNLEDNTVFITVEDEQRKQTYQRNYPQRLSDARRRATIAALFQLRQLLLLPG